MVACFGRAEPFCPRLPSTHTARGSLSSESWNKCAKVVNHVPSLYTPVARPSSVLQTRPKTHFHKRKTPVFAQTFIRRENPYLRPSQKVLGIVKDLSQKVLDRGSGRRPAHPPRILRASLRNFHFLQNLYIIYLSSERRVSYESTSCYA